MIDLHRKTLHSKRSFANARNAESAVYDASEEDAANDASEDDASIRSVHHHLPPIHDRRHIIPTSPLAAQGRMTTSTSTTTVTNKAAAHKSLANNNSTGAGKTLLTLGSDDSGMESGTYDGDIESSTTAAAIAPSKLFGHHPVRSDSLTPSPIASPSSPVFPPVIHSIHSTSPSPPPSFKDSDAPLSFMHAPKTPLAIARGLLSPVEHPPQELLQDAFNPAGLSPEDIQEHIRNIIDGVEPRPYKVNEPPVDRPVRIYADGMHIQTPGIYLRN